MAKPIAVAMIVFLLILISSELVRTLRANFRGNEIAAMCVPAGVQRNP